MGFNSVYRVLQEVFPQVDSRALKAVAIEHSKDADMAVEVVLFEIIPNLPERIVTLGSSSKSQNSLSFFEEGGKTGQLESTMDSLVVNPYIHEQSTEARAVPNIDGSLFGATEALDAGFSAQLNIHSAVQPVNVEPLATSSYLDANGETHSTSDTLSSHLEKFRFNSVINLDIGSSDNQDQGCVKNGDENTVNEKLLVPVSNQLVGICETNLAATQESDPGCSSKAGSEKDAFAVELVDSEDESVVSSVLTRSEEKCSPEFLEEIIEDAKNNKKTLVLAMSSVIDLMKEVESKEKAVEQAKLDANCGCSDILAKVDEVKQALLRAKETNDMHAGEVNAEKAILATELKELQLRLFTLSDERNRSLGILDEMRKALEIRLATALEEIVAAEEHKLENERAAREALIYQESQMEKVVEESKRLKLEAEENSKLQEFLMDRGRAIDILQGEISVKCQDVLLLKEKFDKRIPLSRSLSSSQTSSVLASSGSSFKSVNTPLEPEHKPKPETYESPKKSAELVDSYGFLESPGTPMEAINSIDDRFPSREEKKAIVDDDGWELFDSGDFLLR